MIKISSPDGLFHDGDPVAGVKGTTVSANWLNAAQADLLGIGGTASTVSGETSLTEQHGVVFVNTDPGNVDIHLPALASIVGNKRFFIKNIGAGNATIDAPDGKSIDGEVALVLPAGGAIILCPDGANWRAILLAQQYGGSSSSGQLWEFTSPVETELLFTAPVSGLYSLLVIGGGGGGGSVNGYSVAGGGGGGGGLMQCMVYLAASANLYVRVGKGGNAGPGYNSVYNSVLGGGGGGGFTAIYRNSNNPASYVIAGGGGGGGGGDSAGGGGGGFYPAAGANGSTNGGNGGDGGISGGIGGSSSSNGGTGSMSTGGMSYGDGYYVGGYGGRPAVQISGIGLGGNGSFQNDPEMQSGGFIDPGAGYPGYASIMLLASM